MLAISKKSLKKLQGVHPDIRKVLDEVIKYFDFTVLEGVRTLGKQKEYYNAGRTKTLESKHLAGRAVDIAPYPVDFDDTDRFYYLAGYVMGIAGMLNVNLRFGGDWDMDTEVKDTKFKDLGHFELG